MLVELTETERALRKPDGTPMEPKDFVICPLTFKVTGGKSAVNYDLTPTTMELTVDNEKKKIPAWRSQPTERSHTGLFQAGLQDLKDKNAIPKEWKAYFFPDSQGRQARIAYENRVMLGLSKANRKSWGPSPSGDQKPDKSRFHILVTKERVDAFNEEQRQKNADWKDLTYPVTFQQLQERYPEMYSGSSKSSGSSGGGEVVQVASAPALDLGNLDDDQILDKIEGTSGKDKADEIQEIAEDEVEPDVAFVDADDEGPEDEVLESIEERDSEVAVAASTVVEDLAEDIVDEAEEYAADAVLEEGRKQEMKPAEELETARSGNIPAEEAVKVASTSRRTEEGQTVTLTLPEGEKGFVLNTDVISWQAGDGSTQTRHLIYVDHLEREEWLPEGTTTIDGEDVTVTIIRK